VYPIKWPVCVYILFFSVYVLHKVLILWIKNDLVRFIRIAVCGVVVGFLPHNGIKGGDFNNAKWFLIGKLGMNVGSANQLRLSKRVIVAL